MNHRFFPQHNDDQNLIKKRPTSTISNIPEKIPTNSRNTSPHATNTVQNKRPLVCTTENYLKNFIPFTAPGNIDHAILSKTAVKFSLWV